MRALSSIYCALVVAWPLALASAQPSPGLASEKAVREALQRYRDEPSVREVIAAVHARDGSKSDDLADRARLSGWVPTVGLKARRGQGVDLASSSSQDALRLSTDDDLTLEAALTFDLGRVVFAREEVAISRQAHAEREREGERVREVIELYFERRRLQVERDLLWAAASAQAPAPIEDTAQGEDGPGGRPSRTTAATASPRAAAAGDAIIARTVRIAEIEALLDAFTGGAFRRMMARPHAAKTP